MSRKYYCVVDNIPGYLPDSDNTYTRNRAQAIQEAQWRVNEYRDAGYKMRGNQKEGYWKGHKGLAQGIVVEIMEISKEDYEREVALYGDNYDFC